MITIAEATATLLMYASGVVGSGQPPPLFHVFSEVQVPCPDSETALFQEFPTWPVELDQVWRHTVLAFRAHALL